MTIEESVWGKMTEGTMEAPSVVDRPNWMNCFPNAKKINQRFQEIDRQTKRTIPYSKL
jgi:hypothetical protein